MKGSDLAPRDLQQLEFEDRKSDHVRLFKCSPDSRLAEIDGLGFFMLSFSAIIMAKLSWAEKI